MRKKVKNKPFNDQVTFIAPSTYDEHLSMLSEYVMDFDRFFHRNL